ncbi:four helix bundle protein [Candidatus Nomurabacteria bacterium]|nr:MAG: four helix bundle protein [Candidatus Nomurabacteria bacterium]
MKSYKDLIVWQKGIDLVNEIYVMTKKFPKSEQFSLTSQMLRAAISIPSNIAEGWSRNYQTEFGRFLSIAIASAAELETQVIIAKRQYPEISYMKAESLVFEIQKMLLSLIKTTKK